MPPFLSCPMINACYYWVIITPKGLSLYLSVSGPKVSLCVKVHCDLLHYMRVDVLCLTCLLNALSCEILDNARGIEPWLSLIPCVNTDHEIWP